MTDDLISRQAAIDLFPNDDLYWDTNDGYIAPHFARRMIEELPIKRGKWKRIGANWDITYACSECGEVTVEVVRGKPRYKYCPMCGARMDAE